MVKVGFIGLGAMGYPMASRLSELGYDLILYSRTKSKVRKFIEEFKGVMATTPEELAKKADIIHIMVSDDAASLNVFNGASGLVRGLSKGKVVIQQSTITPMISLELSRFVSATGAKYVEAPVIGSVSEARSGTLVIYVGGDEDDTKIETLKALGSKIVYVGPIPQATALKLAINNLFMTIVASLAESVALTEAYGIGSRKFFDIVKETTWMRNIIERYEVRGLDKDFPVRFKLILASKDARYVVNALEHKGLPAPVASGTAALFAQASIHGYALRDYSNLILYMHELGKKARELRY